MGKLNKCAIVVRVSDPRQATAEENTINLQTNEIRKFIESRNFSDDGIKYEEHRVYELVGVSGSKSFVSTQFGELEMDIALGRVQVVICTALDRLGRNVSGFIEFWEYLRKYKVQLIITRMSLDTSTPVGEMLLVVLMALSKLELDIKTERNRESASYRGEKGLYNGGRPILGYDLNPDPNIAGRLVVNEEEAKVVNMAFEKYLEFGSDKKVADWLCNLGYKNKTWKNRKTGISMGGGKITDNVVRTMLTNITYIALRRYSERDSETRESVQREAPGVWDAIISIELFYEVKEARRRSCASGSDSTSLADGGKERHFSLLIEVVQCRYCGEKLKTTGGTGKGLKQYHYYTCMNDSCPCREDENKPAKNSVNSEELDKVAYNALVEMLASTSMIKEYTQAINRRLLERQPELRGQLKQLSGLLTTLEQDKKDFLKAFGNLEKGSEAFLETENELEKTRKFIDVYRKNRKEINWELDQIRKRAIEPETIRKQLKSMSELMKKGTKEQRRNVIRMLFSSVIVDPEQAQFNLHNDSYFYHHFVNRKHGVQVASDMAPRGGLEPPT